MTIPRPGKGFFSLSVSGDAMSWLLLIPAFYLTLLAILFLVQDALIFHPQPLFRDPTLLNLESHQVEPVSYTSPDGIPLQGWIARAKGASPRQPAPLVIYFGGNAEEASFILHQADRFGSCSLLAVNYRGYGASQGSPTADHLQNDAQGIFDQMVKRPDVDPEKIILMGRSLGSGVAVHLAGHRPVAGVLLITPFDSMVSVAQRLYPMVPVGLLLRHPFDSLALAPTIHAPMLAIIGGKDTLVPPELSHRLVRAWGGEARSLVIPHADHDTPDSYEEYWREITLFLGQLARP